MILKYIVLGGLVVYFWINEEPGLALVAAGSMIPNFGPLLAIGLTIGLLIKSWYGTAAIVAVLWTTQKAVLLHRNRLEI